VRETVANESLPPLVYLSICMFQSENSSSAFLKSLYELKQTETTQNL